MIQDYFMEINEGVFLNECKNKKQKDVIARRKVVQLAVDFMMKMYGDSVTTFQREMVANALIKLFPFVGYQGENNIGTVKKCYAVEKFLYLKKINYFFLADSLKWIQRWLAECSLL